MGPHPDYVHCDSGFGWQQVFTTPCGVRRSEWWFNNKPNSWFCSKCGETHPKYACALTVERWVDESTWWKPWTWGRGHWEVK